MSQQSLIDRAKAPTLAYNEKNWDALKGTLAWDLAYDEIATQRNLRGSEEVIDAWKGWAVAFPDSTATFESAHVSDNTVTLELTWRGTHGGTLHTPGGDIPSTGKKIEMRACQVVEVADGKVIRMRQYFDLMTMLTQIGAHGVVA